ncbi:MAG: phosphopentomutase [Chloroflexi bacterium RBG_16_57_11]|nr:MAG: phosphopentomutase [Chloroflexi bacterium RBG_16_57_11]
MKPIQRMIVIVLDGVGAGEAPDAADYGDVGSNSLGNTARVLGGLDLPNMRDLGLGYITPMMGVPQVKNPGGAFGRLTPRSAGKDTISGHWELMGIRLENAFPTYPDGFPPEVIDEFRRRVGRDILGNKPASGTEILVELGVEHMRTGKPIVYTSADSVFQIAAHEEVIPIEQQYWMCLQAREMLQGKHAVGRGIARPFLGSNPENFTRTTRRRDYPLLPPTQTMLQKAVAAGLEVCSVGKIDDIFAHQGITRSNHTTNNASSLAATLEFLEDDFKGILFVNLIEFDMLYGHRNDAPGYAAALKVVDDAVPEIQRRLRMGDIVLFVADHGVDPTTPSTDHSREFAPLLIFGPPVRPSVHLGDRGAFSDVAATIAQAFVLEPPLVGQSFLEEITA